MMNIKFYSNATPPYNELSNFHYAPFIFSPGHMSETMKNVYPHLIEWLGVGLIFSSSEHLWQALKSKDKTTFLKFTRGGEFDTMTAEFFEKVDKKADGASKVAYWSKKNNVGIVPKMVSTHSRQLGLTNYETRDLYLSEDQQQAVWLDILRQKYVQNPSLRKLLRDTGNTVYLLEFDKGAKSTGAYWGGYIDSDGLLYGQNKMGIYLMLLRYEM